MSPEEREELARLADEQRAKADKEYAQYVAAQDISFNGVMAYPAGAPVPASNVERYGYLTHGLVESADAAAARREQAAEAAREAEAAAAEAHRAEVAAAAPQAASEPTVEPAPVDVPASDSDVISFPPDGGGKPSKPSKTTE